MCHRKQAYIGKERDWMISFFPTHFLFVFPVATAMFIIASASGCGTKMTAWVNEGTLLIPAIFEHSYFCQWNVWSFMKPLFFFFLLLLSCVQSWWLSWCFSFWQTVAITFPPMKTIFYQFYYDTKVWWKMNLHLTFHVVFLFPELFLLYLIVFPAV